MHIFEVNAQGHYVTTTYGLPYKRLFPGHVYVVTHRQLKAGKVGYSQSGPRDWRVQEHIEHGWREHNRLQFDDWHLADAVESYVKLKLKERGIRPFLTAEQMPQKGASETFALDDITVDEVWQLVEEGQSVVRIDRKSTR
ncbi:hypothetical protein [Streptomyces chryseus]